MNIVVKIGTSSITDEHGQISLVAIEKLASEVAVLRSQGHRVVIVTSGAIAAGLPVLGLPGTRQVEVATLQAVSSVGQIRLMAAYDAALARHGLVAGQVLLTQLDFKERSHAVQAQETFDRLRVLGAVPVVNENDAVADEEIRYGDNDELSALVAHLVSADLLVLLTDTPGLYSADPRLDASASLIQEVVETDHPVAVVGGPGTVRGSGGMASKMRAAKMASWSGIRTVIAAADRPGVLAAAVAGDPGVGTVVRPRERRLPARKLWIAFAKREGEGMIEVDDGAQRALLERNTSLLPVGVVAVSGEFVGGDAVAIADKAGSVFAKGLVRMSSSELRNVAGKHTSDLPEGVPHEVVHRDDLVVMT